jgi:hypothetical protein
MSAYPVPLRLGLLALFVWSLPATAQVTASAVNLDSATSVLSRTAPLVRRTVTVGDHRMTLVRIGAPRLPKLPVVPPTPASAEALATEARRAAKTSDYASFMATVHAGPVTEITWQSGDRTFRAYSNIDFRNLDGLAEIETDTAVLSWWCLPFDDSDNGLPEALQKQLHLSAKFSEYVVDATEEEMAAAPEAFAVLDGLHAYYDAHRQELIAAHQQRQAAADARAAELLAHPPVTPDTTVYIWKTAN